MILASQNLAALLGSRICHDLVSPIGAISNGVELLQMSGASASGPEFELINESVDNANARIRFFRIAFGLATDEQRVSYNEVQDILTNLTRGSRMVVNWNSEQDLSRLDVKLVFLLIQCMETALPWGGTVTVVQNGSKWNVTGASDRMREIDDLWFALKDPAADRGIGAAEVQFLLFPTLLAQLNRRLTIEQTSVQVSVEF